MPGTHGAQGRGRLVWLVARGGAVPLGWLGLPFPIRSLGFNLYLALRMLNKLFSVPPSTPKSEKYDLKIEKNLL